MDKIENFRKIIQELLAEYAAIPISNGQIESYTAFDTAKDHYQVINIGWDGYRRVYGCVLHLDIKGDKIWVQHNMTEISIGHKLVDRGISKDDIVLGFQDPQMRQYTDFAAVL